jgi:hypothetical protein
MRDDDQQQQAMFNYISPEARGPEDHPLRPIRIMVGKAWDLSLPAGLEIEVPGLRFKD